MFDIIIKNSTVVTPEETYRADVALLNGKIALIEENISEKGKQIIDGTGLHLLPGVVDVHVHFREPGATYKEDIESGTKASVAGGVTTVLEMPNTSPPTVNQATLDNKKEIARETAYSNIGFHVGATKQNLESLNDIKGYRSIKVYAGSSTGDLLLSESEDQIKLFQSTDKIICVHAEDEAMIQKALKFYKGDNNPEIHSCIRHEDCAYSAVEKLINFAKKYNKHIHICHISTAKELELIQQAKSEGVNVTCEVAPHHLFFNEHHYVNMNNLVKVNPPIRSEADNEAMFKGLIDETIDFIATDHAPHSLEEKQKDYWDAPSGMPSIEFSLPLLLNEVNNEKITLEQLVKMMSKNPSKIFGMNTKGEISDGFDADLVLIDMNKTRTVPNKVYSKSGWTPFEGWEITGWPVKTFVKGQLVFNDGKFIKPNTIDIIE